MERVQVLPRFWVFSERSETAGVHLSSHIDVHWRVGLGQLGRCGDASCTHWGGWRLCQTRPSRHGHTAVMFLRHRHKTQKQVMNEKVDINIIYLTVLTWVCMQMERYLYVWESKHHRRVKQLDREAPQAANVFLWDCTGCPVQLIARAIMWYAECRSHSW